MPVSRELLLADQIRGLLAQNGISAILSILSYLCDHQAEDTAAADAAKAKVWMKISIGLDKLNQKAEEAHL